MREKAGLSDGATNPDADRSRGAVKRAFAAVGSIARLIVADRVNLPTGLEVTTGERASPFGHNRHFNRAVAHDLAHRAQEDQAAAAGQPGQPEPVQPEHIDPQA